MSERHRLELRCPSGNPRETTIHLDGEQLTFVSRVELVLDVNGETTAKLTVPGALLDIDADVAAFVEAHAEREEAAHVRARIGTTCAVAHFDKDGNPVPCPDAKGFAEAVSKTLLNAGRRKPPYSR